MLDTERISKYISKESYYEIDLNSANIYQTILIMEKGYLYRGKELNNNLSLECIKVEKFCCGSRLLFVKKLYLSNMDVNEFIKLLKPASPRYLINNIKNLESIEIDKGEQVHTFKSNFINHNTNPGLLLALVTNSIQYTNRMLEINGQYYREMVLSNRGKIEYNYKYEHK